jgi:hypothetical protein
MSVKNHLRFLSILAFSAVSAASAVHGQAAGGAPAAPVTDAEEQLDEGLKRFGYLAGLTRGCIAEEQRAKLDREALDLHASISRLLGTDRAYLFAVSMGYGTSVTIDTKDCPNVLSAYDARVAKHRAAAGPAK